MLHVSDLTYRIGERVLFDRASFALAGRRPRRARRPQRRGQDDAVPDHRRARSRPESGKVDLPRNMRIGAVAQEAPAGPESL